MSTIHRQIIPPAEVYKRLAGEEFTTGDLTPVLDALLCPGGNPIGLPGTAHLYNLVAARLSEKGDPIPLLTSAEDEADPEEFPELHGNPKEQTND